MSISAFKRKNRRKTMEKNRLVMAYNVPGTREAGELAMLMAAKQKPVIVPGRCAACDRINRHHANCPNREIM
jgi:hypothetical protein